VAPPRAIRCNDPAARVVQGSRTGRRDRRVHRGPPLEALTAAAVTLLTIYDMAKGVDRGMIIGDICLVEKSGGQSGSWKRRPQADD